MKPVLFLSLMNSAAWGGSEELWHKSAIWLARKNYPVGVCCFNWPGKQDKLEQLQKAGCKIYLLPGKNETRSVFGKLKLKKAAKSVPFTEYETVVINQGGWMDAAYGLFKKLYKQLPDYILTYHNYNAREKLPAGKLKLLKEWIINASANIACAAEIFSVFKEVYSFEVPRQAVLINPITFTPPDTVTPSALFPENKIILSVIAALDIERKGQDILLKALSQNKWKEKNWKLNLYGEGKDKLVLEKLIEELQLQSKVFLRGYTKDVKKALIESHLVLQITHMDGMPISVMEAMAMSKPVLISNVGDMAAWIKHGENGWVAESVTVEGIDKTLEQAWKQMSNWDETGKRSFEIFREKYPADPVIFFLEQTGILNEKSRKV